MIQQSLNLHRVRSNIAATVVEFCRGRVGGTFHMVELQQFVADRCMVSPDSPSRILRDLRRSGVVDYEVVSRAQSLYRIVSVMGDCAGAAVHPYEEQVGSLNVFENTNANRRAR